MQLHLLWGFSWGLERGLSSESTRQMLKKLSWVRGVCLCASHRLAAPARQLPEVPDSSTEYTGRSDGTKPPATICRWSPRWRDKVSVPQHSHLHLRGPASLLRPQTQVTYLLRTWLCFPPMTPDALGWTRHQDTSWLAHQWEDRVPQLCDWEPQLWRCTP